MKLLAERLRVIDTGLRGARVNMALSAALLEGRREGTTPDTLRIFRFQPSVLIGRHQNLEAEVDMGRLSGIETARRLTGGGAVYVDELQFCWELVLTTDRSMNEAAQQICTAVAEGLCRLGIDACFRPDNDIVVNGRKLCGCAGLSDGQVLLYHGTVLVDAEPERMAELLKPTQGHVTQSPVASNPSRMVTLRELLGRPLPFNVVVDALLKGIAATGAELVPGQLSEAEEALAARLLAEEYGQDSFVLEGR